MEDVWDDAEAYYEQKEPSMPGNNDVAPVLVDYKGVVMIKDHIAEERPSDKDPKKTGKNKMEAVDLKLM